MSSEDLTVAADHIEDAEIVPAAAAAAGQTVSERKMQLAEPDSEALAWHRGRRLFGRQAPV